MDQYFENITEIKISLQKIGKRLHVNIFKKVTTKFGDNFYIYDKVNKCVYFGNSLLKAYLSRVLENEGKDDFKLQKEGEYYHLNDKLDDICDLKILNEVKDKRTNRI